jgi:carbamoyltransferase
MIRWGWTGMSHDASLAVLDNNKILFAAHSERYSRIKNDKWLHSKLIEEALSYGKPDEVYYYENPWLKKTRQAAAKQFSLLSKQSPDSHLRQVSKVTLPKSKFTTHHRSHAAAGYYTSPFTSAAVLVIDSIGEWETMSLWKGRGNKLHKIWSQSYPHSIGLWYSAMTQRIGLKPQEHEYILMGMAAIGDPLKYKDEIINDFIAKFPTVENPSIKFKRNCHRGCMDWRPDLNTPQDYADIAAAVQSIYEDVFEKMCHIAYCYDGSGRLVISGGCALNCVANTKAFDRFDDVWIMPNPGDAGSSIGCVLAHTNEFVNFGNAFLGTNIQGKYPVDEIIDELLTNKITAVASGRAEFGPRALGHRSILADPRGDDVKDRVNNIKHRESFRPFAPMILQEYAPKYFDMPTVSSKYMQYVVRCKYPEQFPAIVHYDGTSRVQTVSKTAGSIRKLLEVWYEKTGCPMLLNTSLNIKGEPLVNDISDARRWSEEYGVKVCLPE